MSFGLFSAKGYVIVFGAVSLGDMKAESFLNIRWDEAAFLTVKGADGSITRCASGNTLVHVDYIVKRSSNDNPILSAILNADMAADGGAGAASLLLKDPSGSELLTSAKAWISGFPDAGRGKEVGGDVTWTFDCQVLPGQYILGGNQIA